MEFTDTEDLAELAYSVWARRQRTPPVAWDAMNKAAQSTWVTCVEVLLREICLKGKA